MTSDKTVPACRVLDCKTSIAVRITKVTRNLIRNLLSQTLLWVAFPLQTCHVDRHTIGWLFVPLSCHFNACSPSTPVVIMVGPGHHERVKRMG